MTTERKHRRCLYNKNTNYFKEHESHESYEWRLRGNTVGVWYLTNDHWEETPSVFHRICITSLWSVGLRQISWDSWDSCSKKDSAKPHRPTGGNDVRRQSNSREISVEIGGICGRHYAPTALRTGGWFIVPQISQIDTDAMRGACQTHRSRRRRGR